ncbi:uncharacterized protein LOC135710749 [Ochlerotatus camptorhynchus]|uniref:uncharacterized protein LOC135710749 n=1 Tax=Ochlerotatus camptorhynchus TaxID=644619 RepID=UPI0031D67C2F
MVIVVLLFYSREKVLSVVVDQFLLFQVKILKQILNFSIAMDVSASSIEKKKFREILAEGCISTEDGFVLCAIDAANSCKYRQKAEKFDAGNFIRHLRTEHTILAKSRGLLKDEAEVPSKRKKASKKMIAIDRQTFVEAILKLVTVHHVPLHCVEWEGFQLLLKPIGEALNMCMNRPNVLRHLTVAATKIRSAIRSLVNGKLICLKIDSASRHGRHILGVNIQFFDPEQQQVVILTVGK